MPSGDSYLAAVSVWFSLFWGVGEAQVRRCSATMRWGTHQARSVASEPTQGQCTLQLLLFDSPRWVVWSAGLRRT